MSEEALLMSVRDHIRELAGYGPDECDVQMDEFVPNGIGDSYVAVLPGDLNAGPRHDSSGGVIDEIYSVRVLVIQRAAAIPADRLGNHWLTNVGGIAERCRRIRQVIDFNYSVTTMAKTFITGSTEGFNHPLVWRSTGRTEPADSEIFNTAKYNVKTHQAGGVKRMIEFGGCRRTTTR